jgi:histidinol-phosphate aminotransferase
MAATMRPTENLSRRNFLRTANVAAVTAFVLPGEALAWAEPQRVRLPGGPIRLDSNENPYGPWPSLREVMREALAQANRYPDGAEDRLREAIAKYHSIRPEQVLLGCGSGEILKIVGDAYCGPGRPLVQASPTFGLTGVFAERHGGEVRRIPLTADYEHDLDAMAAAAKDAAVVFVCNPNNPTGNLTPRAKIEAFLGRLGPATMVLVDEAYHHFVDAPAYVSFLDRPVADPRLIVSRTFSKIFGLAGMRAGYAVGAPEVIDRLQQFSIFSNVNVAAADCCVAALADKAGLAAAARRNKADREEFFAQCRKRGLEYIPSETNFVMVKTGKPIRDVISAFRKANVAIGRPFPPMDRYMRISLGMPEEMEIFWKVWDKGV